MSTTKLNKTHFELRAALRILRIKQSDLARLCGVTRNQAWVWCEGNSPIPMYVWTIVRLAKQPPKYSWGLIRDPVPDFEIKKEDVFSSDSKSYRSLAKKFHPDLSGRDTNAEMQIINRFKGVK